MNTAIGRRTLILATCVAGVVLWGGTTQAKPLSFTVALSGTQSVPPVNAAGKGTADLTYDTTTRKVTWTITYSGLSSPVTMAHFHGPAAAGKNAPVVVWLTTKGEAPKSPVEGEATLTADQAKQFTAGEWYINVHTQSNPAGEIRGQVVPPKG